MLAAGMRGRCVRCATPRRSGSSRPELDRYAWQKLRRAARLRDGNRCVHCGARERLSVHHAVPGSNLLDDLLTLCWRCHSREHARKTPASKVVFLRENHATPDSAVSQQVLAAACDRFDNGDVRRLRKLDRTRPIDAAVALALAVQGATIERFRSVYEDRGLIVL
jgi:HNH endonuclease